MHSISVFRNTGIFKILSQVRTQVPKAIRGFTEASTQYLIEFRPDAEFFFSILLSFLFHN